MSYNRPLSAEDLAGHLDRLSGEMHWLADLMKFYGGFNKEMAEHAHELHGAGEMAEGWADGIRKQAVNLRHRN